jgi:hypothetical protein
MRRENMPRTPRKRARTTRRRELTTDRGFHVLAVNMTSGTYKYLREVFYLGWEGSPQNPEEMGINPELKKLILGAHQVLRGGTVELQDDGKSEFIEIRVRRVTAAGVENLHAALEQSIAETKELITLLAVEGIGAAT